MSRFVDCIMQEFWEDHKWKIFYRQCLPFVSVVVCNIIYLENTGALNQNAEEREKLYWTRVSLGSFIIVNICYLTY